MKINRVDWFKLTTRLIHLQMNLFTIIFDKFWEKTGIVACLGRYAGILKQSKVSKDMKNFHVCDTFFKHIINIYAITLIMKKSGQKNINNF